MTTKTEAEAKANADFIKTTHTEVIYYRANGTMAGEEIGRFKRAVFSTLTTNKK